MKSRGGDDMGEDDLLTPAQIAERLQVAETTVHKWLRSGDLKGMKLGHRIWRVKEGDLEAFLEQRTTGGKG